MAKRLVKHKGGYAKAKKDGSVTQAKARKSAGREPADSPSSVVPVFKTKRAFTKYRPVPASTFVRQRAQRFDRAMGSAAGAARSSQG